MEVLVTGAAGFIGSQVVRELVKHGHGVHTLIRPGSEPWRLRDVTGITVHEGSLDNPAELGRIVRTLSPQSCFHLAWSPAGDLTSSAHLTFARQSLDFARQLADTGCEQFVGTGTNYEYDCSVERVSERTPLCPHTLYAAAKLALCTGLRDIEHTHPMRTVWTRPFFLYGPGEAPRRLVPSVIRALRAHRPVETTEGTQVRDFLHVEDVATGICAAAEHRLPVANVGAGTPVSVRRLVTMIATMFDGEDLLRFGALPQRPGEPASIYADNTLLLAAGWRPRFELDQGLRDTVRWWAEHEP